MSRMTDALTHLETGPKTTRELVEAAGLGWRHAARVRVALRDLAETGVVVGERVSRDNSKGGPPVTTRWRIAI